MLRIQVTLCHWVRGSQHFWGTPYLCSVGSCSLDDRTVTASVSYCHKNSFPNCLHIHKLQQNVMYSTLLLCFSSHMWWNSDLEVEITEIRSDHWLTLHFQHCTVCFVVAYELSVQNTTLQALSVMKIGHFTDLYVWSSSWGRSWMKLHIQSWKKISWKSEWSLLSPLHDRIDNCAHLGYCVVRSGNFLLTLRDNLIVSHLHGSVIQKKACSPKMECIYVCVCVYIYI
jgi:hypothetical protein